MAEPENISCRMLATEAKSAVLGVMANSKDSGVTLQFSNSVFLGE